MVVADMLHVPEIAEQIGGLEWADRSDYWRQLADAAKPKRRIRQRNPRPLILCGHGISMRIDNGALVIRDGYTHYPQTQTTHRYFPHDLNLPTRILLLDGSGTLSFDVLSWLSEQGVSLARIKWTGEIATVTSGSGYIADREKVCWQHDTRADNAKRLAFASGIIFQKLTASVATLEQYAPESRSRETAISKASAGMDRLKGETFSEINTIFAIEGECAAKYFVAWQGLHVEWIGTTRRPVPEAWTSFGGRASLANGEKPENRNASHPINAMLNYAYAVRQAQMQIQAVADGYDPTFGIMHNGRRGKPAWVLDIIEPERPKVDAAILRFVRDHKFAASDFVLRRDGACRLSPQLARMVAAMVA